MMWNDILHPKLRMLDMVQISVMVPERCIICSMVASAVLVLTYFNIWDGHFYVHAQCCVQGVGCACMADGRPVAG